jgi:hypothetical protein
MGHSLLDRPFLWLWLVTSALLGYWFAWVAVTALVHPMSDSGGNLVYLSTAAGHTVYPFTYIAAIAGFVGVTFAVYFAERPSRAALVLAPLVGYVSAIGMINVYEQVFLVGLESTTHSSFWWGVDWGTPGAAIFSFLGLTWVLAGLPWWRRANLPLAAPWIALWLGSMALWMGLGFPSVQSGLAWVYALNTVSRVASEMILVALVTPPQLRVRFLELAHRWAVRRKPATHPAPVP